MAVVGYVPDAWRQPGEQRFVLDVSAFKHDGHYLRNVPQNPEHSALYRTFLANAWRMNLWLLIEEVEKSKMIWGPEVRAAQSKGMAQDIDSMDPGDEAGTAALLAHALRAIKAAKGMIDIR